MTAIDICIIYDKLIKKIHLRMEKKVFFFLNNIIKNKILII